MPRKEVAPQAPLLRLPFCCPNTFDLNLKQLLMCVFFLQGNDVVDGCRNIPIRSQRDMGFPTTTSGRTLIVHVHPWYQHILAHPFDFLFQDLHGSQLFQSPDLDKSTGLFPFWSAIRITLKNQEHIPRTKPEQWFSSCSTVPSRGCSSPQPARTDFAKAPFCVRCFAHSRHTTRRKPIPFLGLPN